MSTPFLSEIRIMSFNFPPKGWALCNGQLLPINQNQALFSLLGTNYGGNGTTNFGLPDLRSRIPISMGSGHILGEHGGAEAHLLAIAELPAHVHQFVASNASATLGAAGRSPANAAVAAAVAATSPVSPVNIFGTGAPSTSFASNMLSNTGGGQPHGNIEPYLALNFCIALQGIFPSQT
jgi:microcystin-dependent protein